MGLKSFLARLQSRAADTPDTSEKSTGYQRKPIEHAGCTLDTSDTPLLNNTHEDAQIGQFGEAVNDPAGFSPDGQENLRKPVIVAVADDPGPEPPFDPDAWRELAEAYHAHHFSCAYCIAAGRGNRYGVHCGVGAALWTSYENTQTVSK